MNDKQEGLSEKAEAAFQEAAAAVVQHARQTGTPVVVWENGQIKEIPGACMEREISHPPTKRPSH